MSSKNPHNHQLTLHWYSRLMNWYRWNDAVQIPFFNPAARLALGAKQALDKWQTDRFCANKTTELEQWLHNTQLFFVFSSPRSGTVFLTDLFLNTAQYAQIEHEANIVDYPAFARAIQHPQDADSYINDFRLKDMFKRAYTKKMPIYGEINPFLALHCAAIGAALPAAKRFHLVKDGRSVVRSMFSRTKLGAKDPMSKPIFPPPNDPYSDKWQHLTRFERLCWQWQFENRFMRQHIPTQNRLYFELLSKDYDYFKTHLLDPLGLQISANVWQDYVNTPKNESAVYRMPHHTQWTPEDKRRFEQICGEEMAMYEWQ